MDTAINNQGKKEYTMFISNMKQEILGDNIEHNIETEPAEKLTKNTFLQASHEKWTIVCEHPNWITEQYQVATKPFKNFSRAYLPLLINYKIILFLEQLGFLETR